MKLQLKNIGMIKEANVKIDGLTVIAGENDTGKSTTGKALFMIIEFIKIALSKSNEMDYINKTIVFKSEKKFFLPQVIFASQISSEAKLKLNFNQNNINLFIDNRSLLRTDKNFTLSLKEKSYFSIFIETPLIWNLTDFFRDIAQVESQMNIKLDYPYLMKDLNFKLHIKSALDGLYIKEKVIYLMGGEFKKDKMGRYYFDKQGQRIELINTATGIKYFGIFQILSQNNWLNENTVLILDEPEVHLHPKWQLEMAKIIVELVKNGVKILVTSHSPYMIEALKRYSELEDIEDKTNFYLAENGYIEYQDSLENIFEKLAKPMQELQELKWQSLNKH